MTAARRPPVYKVKVPEYHIPSVTKKNKLIEVPHFGKVPEQYVTLQPDFNAIGTKIDTCLKKHFKGQDVVVRVLGSQEHPGKTSEEIIAIIKKLGYDRYDAKRIGDRYHNLANKRIDFFALPFHIDASGEYFRDFLLPFYYWPLIDRGSPVRLDIAIIYDPKQLEVVEHEYKGREGEIKRDGYVFKDTKQKPKAIKAIIQIL